MKEKIFTLRVDIESDKGIKEGLPKLLDLLREYNIKASFYLVMGGESGLFSILRYNKKLETAGERKIKIWGLKEKLRIAFFPRDFVTGNIKILKRILDEGHELGIHGWKHRAWTRGLDSISIGEHIEKAKKKYIQIFNCEPKSFSAPGFNTNQRVLNALEESGFTHISDFRGKGVEKIGNLTNVPMTINGEDNMPIIEYLSDKSDEEIIKILKEEIKKKALASFYIHDLYEARFKLNALEEIFRFVKEEEISTKRIDEFSIHNV